MVEVRLTAVHWGQVQTLLLMRRDVESKCFLLCSAIQYGSRVALIVRDIIPVPASAYECRTAGLVVTDRAFVHGLLVRCAVEGLCLVEAHSHPWSSSAQFSSIDLASDERKFRATQVMSPPFRHAALVFGGDMSYNGHAWSRRRTRFAPIDRIKVIGSPIRIQTPTSWPVPPLPRAQMEVFDRQVRAFGEGGQRVLRNLTVGVVGLGGLGSQIAQSLALLGVGRLILVDPDKLERTNGNRVVSVRARQIARREAKVEAIARTLKEACSAPLRCVPISREVAAEDAWRHLLWADVLVGAVDSASARQFLNTVSVCGLIPLLDGGVGIQAEEGRVTNAGGQVKTVVPGIGYCLACLGDDVRQKVEEQMTPEQRAESQRRGYVRGERVPNPQVVFLNGVVANVLVLELIKLVTGCLPASTYLYYDMVEQHLFAPAGAERRSDCVVCGSGGLLGSGEDVLREMARDGYSGAQMPLATPAGPSATI